MGKRKTPRGGGARRSGGATNLRKPQGFQHQVTKSKSKPAKATPHRPAPTLPFTAPRDRILLIGEGDFSHARSLLTRYYGNRGARIVATAYDDEALAYEKYPQARETVETLRKGGVVVLFGVDAGKLGKGLLRRGGRERDVLRRVDGGDGASDHGEDGHGEADCEFEGVSTDGSDFVYEEEERQTEPDRQDFLKLKKGKSKAKANYFDRIIFNFPHVGGKSTDVNRQVRANQDLLVRFFKAAAPLLRPPRIPPSRNANWEVDDSGNSDAGGGQIVVTLFEGLPYSLWNIRDLARHTGLRVVTSFRFPWEVYPGYQHARTIGNIRSKEALDAGDDITEERRGWKGEEREARSFLFGIAETDSASTQVGQRRKKRKTAGDESSSTDGD